MDPVSHYKRVSDLTLGEMSFDPETSFRGLDVENFLEKLKEFKEAIRNSGLDRLESVTSRERAELLTKIEMLEQPFRALGSMVFKQFGYDYSGVVLDASLASQFYSADGEVTTSENEQNLAKINKDLNLLRNMARTIVESETQGTSVVWRRSPDNLSSTYDLKLDAESWNNQIVKFQELLASFVN